MRRLGRRRRKARALQSGAIRILVLQHEPHVALGFKRPLGGWWTTRRGAWKKTSFGHRRRIAHVSALRDAVGRERALLEWMRSAGGRYAGEAAVAARRAAQR